MRHPDLFGGETPVVHKGADHAHAAPPGSGPPRETCGSCQFLVPHHPGEQSYVKGGLIDWTFGPGTDIRLKDPACRFWRYGGDPGNLEKGGTLNVA